jgi:putative SOS response-associated peptidase YedK
MFRQAFRKHRALVPVDGFYKWRRSESGKQPFFFSRADGELTVFAGLWEYWEREGNGLYTCSIITTEAGEDMEDVHNRMPVILEPSTWDKWLNPDSSREDLGGLLVPAAGGTLVKHTVSRTVGSVRNDGPELVEEVAA